MSEAHKLLTEVDAHMRHMWNERRIPHEAWPAHLARRVAAMVHGGEPVQPQRVNPLEGPLVVRENGDSNSYALLHNGNWLMNLLHNGAQVSERQIANMHKLARAWNELEQREQTVAQLAKHLREYLATHDAVLLDGYMLDAISSDLAKVASDSVGGTGAWTLVSDKLPPVNELLEVAVEFDFPGDWRMKMGYMDEGGSFHVWGASWVPSVWRLPRQKPDFHVMKRVDQQ